MRKIMICGLLAGGMFISGGVSANESYADNIFAYEVDAAEIAQFLEAVHTKSDIANSDGAKSGGATAQEGLVTHDETCQACHGSNFFDEVVVTGRRTYPGGSTSLPPPVSPLIPGGLGWDWGGGGDESCPITSTQQKGFGDVTKQAVPCPPPAPPPPVPPVCTPEANLLAQEMRRALRDPRVERFELGGLIYRRADGTIGASPWVSGTSSGVDIFSAPIPAGATIIGGWHTHPTGTWAVDPITGAYTSAGQYFSRNDLSIANPEWVGRELDGGLAYSRSQRGFLGLGLALNANRPGVPRGLFFLRDSAIDTSTYTWNPATIMNYADNITNCGL
ncbi:MAG: hypothetical protein L3J65_00045 [Robiginitomaculum sp.]|nr:hypothetical protein [Robiginitomaculum sp.]